MWDDKIFFNVHEVVGADCSDLTEISRHLSFHQFQKLGDGGAFPQLRDDERRRGGSSACVYPPPGSPQKGVSAE